MRKDAVRNDCFEVVCIPTITFWSTLIPGQSARFWKVRAIPARAMAWGARSRRLRPSYVTRPSSGSYTRLTTLNSVVLPAPFGPISAQISPSPTVNDSCRRATMPPKRTVTSETSTSAAMASSPPWVLRAGRPGAQTPRAVRTGL